MIKVCLAWSGAVWFLPVHHNKHKQYPMNIIYDQTTPTMSLQETKKNMNINLLVVASKGYYNWIQRQLSFTEIVLWSFYLMLDRQTPQLFVSFSDLQHNIIIKILQNTNRTTTLFANLKSRVFINFLQMTVNWQFRIFTYFLTLAKWVKQMNFSFFLCRVALDLVTIQIKIDLFGFCRLELLQVL